MSKRTEKDEVIDRAIEQLIAEGTEGFALATVEDRDVHLVQAASRDEQLLAVYLLVSHLVKQTAAEGTPLEPIDVLLASFEVAAEYGLMDQRATYEKLL